MMHKERAQDIIAYILGFKPAKTVVHRLLIILLHILLWGLFLTLPLLIYRIEILDSHFLYRELINKLFLIFLFYFHYYYLIPRFFKKKRLVHYFVSVIATLIIICVQQLLVEYYFQSLYRQTGFSILGGRTKFMHRVSPVAKSKIWPLLADQKSRPDSTGILDKRMVYGSYSYSSDLTPNSQAKAFFDSGLAVSTVSDEQEDFVPAMPTVSIAMRGRAGVMATPAMHTRPFKGRFLFVQQNELRRERIRQAGLKDDVVFVSANDEFNPYGQNDPWATNPVLTGIGTGQPVLQFPFLFIDSLVENGMLPLNVSHRTQFRNEPLQPANMLVGPRGFAVGGIDDMRTLKLFNAEIPLMALPMMVVDILTSAILILLISGFIKLANSLLISEKQKKALENQRLNAELNFLKLQINPHFLFNTLNSIYSQAHLKSEQTEYSILKFSQIMRYVLYDSATEKIPLAKDLEYITNYIDLQKLRISKNVTIHYEVSGNTDGLLIAPLLLITFIENAFKHGVSYTIPSEIKIRIELMGHTIRLSVGNAVTAQRQNAAGGVGLINAKRRLDVLYPNRYMLDVVENNSLYIVNLKIELDYDEN